MSLFSIMNNFMTVQSSEGAVQSAVGSIDRAGSWVNVFTNVACAIQEKRRIQTVTERFSRLEEEHRDLFYHRNLEVYNVKPAVQLRVIVWKANPRLKITDYTLGEDAYDIYQFMGHVEQVKKRAIIFFVLLAQRNDRWYK